MRIVDVREITQPIASPIRNAYIDFSKMTTSLVAVVTDVFRDGRRVVGYGFNSNGRYGQGGLIRERFRDRILEAAPESLLDEGGNVCEGTGENIFVIKDGVINTPGQAASILDGINRKSCIQIARDLGYEVVERDIARAELALADEVFLTGTAAELTPMREIDDIEIGPPGPITREIQGVFEDALCGRDARYADWLDLVPVPSQA